MALDVTLILRDRLASKTIRTALIPASFQVLALGSCPTGLIGAILPLSVPGGDMDNTCALVLRDTSQLDRFELEQLAGPGLVEIVEPTVDPNEHGEFLTAAAVIWLSAQGIRVLATWLNKRRSEEKVTVSGTLRKPDGSEQEITINWSSKNSEAPMAEQIKALGKALNVDPSSLPS